VEVEALVERAGAGSGAEGESAASLAEERVTLDDMSSHSEGSIIAKRMARRKGKRRGDWYVAIYGWLREKLTRRY